MPTSGQMSLSMQLRSLINNGPYSQHEIATLTGMRQPTISRFITGRSSMQLNNIDKLAKLFGLSFKCKYPAGNPKFRPDK